MRKAAAAVVAAIALVAGCGGESGTAQPVAERWDPCSIPQDAIAAAGLDPDYKDVGWSDGIVVDDWSPCRYRGPAGKASYFFNVMSSDVHTIGDARADDSHLDGQDFTISERDAFRYTTALARSITDCNVALALPDGVVVFTVNSLGTDEIGADACVLAESLATDLEIWLPDVN